jgi:hypothetical protein
MWKNMVEPERPHKDNVIRRMCLACWITKATHTHTQYVILTGLSCQELLRERILILRFTYVSCLSHWAIGLIFLFFLNMVVYLPGWLLQILLYISTGVEFFEMRWEHATLYNLGSDYAGNPSTDCTLGGILWNYSLAERARHGLTG